MTEHYEYLEINRFNNKQKGQNLIKVKFRKYLTTTQRISKRNKESEMTTALCSSFPRQKCSCTINLAYNRNRLQDSLPFSPQYLIIKVLQIHRLIKRMIAFCQRVLICAEHLYFWGHTTEKHSNYRRCPRRYGFNCGNFMKQSNLKNI